MRFSSALLAIFCHSALTLYAQQNEPANGENSGNGEGGTNAAASEASITTQRNARAMTLSVPAPRGMILDRQGRPLAQNIVAYHIALDLTKLGNESDPDKITAWAQSKIDLANQLTNGKWEENQDRLVDYYKNRRWIPKKISSPLNEDKAKEIQSKLPDGLVLLPVYLRHYPEKSLGAHMIGYVGTLQRLPDGPINHGDPLFESSQGKAGFEMLFDADLRGRDGVKRMLFDDKGQMLLEEWSQRPRAGGTIVTTLDLDWQRRAEEVLRKGCERGAMVIIDVNSGDVLVMASRPSFDLNDFIPGISQEKYQALLDNPGKPLFARAFQAEYPPASTFKPVVALAAINNGVVTEKTLIDSPYRIKIGNHWFHNHTKTPEGSINVRRAMARSTNPWFYQVGIKTGPEAFLSVARRLGFGSATSLPLVGEKPGLIPTNEYMQQTHGRRFTDGDTAQLAIGQSVMLATPLQVAQAMAGIANGGNLPQLRLVNQVQDFHGRVVVSPTPAMRNDLNLDPKAVDAVHKGMVDVIHAGHGTGKQAALSFTTMAGKTGTAQWGPRSLNQGLAWFAGYFPADNPRYAYAVLYEGKPNQNVSGGRLAAPMVRNFFQPMADEIKKLTAPPARAMVIVEEDEEGAVASIDPSPEAAVTDEIAPPLPIMDDGIPAAIPIEDEEEMSTPEIPVAIPIEDDELGTETMEETEEEIPTPATEGDDEEENMIVEDIPMAIPVEDDEE